MISLEILVAAHAQDLARESAMAALAAKIPATSRTNYREGLARALLFVGNHLEPSSETSLKRSRSLIV